MTAAKKRRGVRAPNPRAVAAAERLVSELGLISPEDIDIALIAAHVGTTPIVRDLPNENAHVLRSSRRALAAIDRAQFRTSEWRFALAHETGHMLLDGEHDDFARCTSEAPRGARRAIESAANDFAAELLMPRAMLLARLGAVRALDLARVVDLAETFDVPVQAMALRLLALAAHDRAVVYATGGKVAWFAHGRDFDAVDVRWGRALPEESAALRATSGSIARATIAARAWSEHADAEVTLDEEACASAERGIVVWLH